MDQPGASPQLEDGYTRIADELLEALVAARMPGTVLRLALAVIRETYGYGKTETKIGSARLAELLGVNGRGARKALADAEAWGVIQRAGDVVKLQKDFTLWTKPEARAAGWTWGRSDVGPTEARAAGCTWDRAGRVHVGPGRILDKASREKSRETRQVSPPKPPTTTATTGERDSEHQQPAPTSGTSGVVLMEIQQLLAEHVPDLDPQYQSMWARDLGQVVSRGQNTLAEVSARLKADKPGFGDFPRPRDWIKRMEGAGRMTEYDDREAAKEKAAAPPRTAPDVVDQEAERRQMIEAGAVIFEDLPDGAQEEARRAVRAEHGEPATAVERAEEMGRITGWLRDNAGATETAGGES